jgi:hypothetical protein
MKQTLTVKLKPYLQEFLLCKLSDEAAEASKRNLIGAMLSPLVEYAPRDYIFKKKDGPDYITFEIPRELGKKETRYGVLTISEGNQREFERMLTSYFNDIFFQYVDDKIRYTTEIKKCILLFCSDYDISFNSITYEMLKKKYYRRKKSINRNKIFTRKMSLSSPLIFLL